MTRISKTQRWLDLIAHLAGRHYPTPVSELMRLPAYAGMKPLTARRVFERDKEELRQAGVPLEMVRCSAGGAEESDGYVLSSGDFFLPYLRIVRGEPRPPVAGRRAPGSVEVTAEEAADAMEALERVARLPASPLAEEARRAYAKLSLDLESFPGGPVVYADPPGGAEPAAALRALTDAVTARRRVRFRYRGIRRGEVTERHVSPYGLIRTGGHWYLVGHDEDRGALREFRVSRAEAVRAEGSPGAFAVPAGFQLERHLGRDAWELGEGPVLEVHVRFTFPLSLWADRNARGYPVEAVGDGTAVRGFQVRDPGPFLRWILSHAGEAEILSPPELRAQAAALARATADRYADPHA